MRDGIIAATKFSNIDNFRLSVRNFPVNSQELDASASKSKLYGLLINLITNLCFAEIEIDKHEIMELVLSNEFTLDEFFELILRDIRSQNYLQFMKVATFFDVEVKILSRNKFKKLSDILDAGNGTASLVYQSIFEFLLVSELPDGCSVEDVFLNSYREVLDMALECSLNQIVSISNFINSADSNSKIVITDFFSFKTNSKGKTYVAIDLKGLVSFLEPPVSRLEVLGCPAARISRFVRTKLRVTGFDMQARTYIELQMIAVAKWLPVLKLAYEEGRLKI